MQAIRKTLAAALAAALARAGLATDISRFVDADDATHASCDAQAVELLQGRVSTARAGGDAEGTKLRPGSTPRGSPSPHARAAASRQPGKSTDVAEASLTSGLGGNGTDGAAGEPPAGVFDCGAHPRLCMEPFNCNGTDTLGRARTFLQGAMGDGPNFESWCNGPEHEDYLAQCIIDKDPVGAGRTYHGQVKVGLFGPDTLHSDASYCFLEGFCLNTAVTNDTTVDEATLMCNQRYGDQWRTAGHPFLSPAYIAFEATRDPSKPGFTSQNQTTPLGLVACMMGNYHCDVMMCKATHCQDPEMIDKYGHFLTDLSWDKSTQPWQVGTH